MFEAGEIAAAEKVFDVKRDDRIRLQPRLQQPRIGGALIVGESREFRAFGNRPRERLAQRERAVVRRQQAVREADDENGW